MRQNNKMDVVSEFNKRKDIDDQVEVEHVMTRREIVDPKTMKEAVAKRLKENCQGLADEISQLEKHVTELQKELCDVKKSNEEVDAKVDELSDELDKARAQLKPWDEKLAVHEVMAGIASGHKDILSKTFADRADLGIQIEHCNKIISKEQMEILNLTQESKNLNKEVSELHSKLWSFQSKSISQKYQIRHLENAITGTNKRIFLIKPHLKVYEGWLKKQRDRGMDI